jgi:hypothetical protein
MALQNEVKEQLKRLEKGGKAKTTPIGPNKGKKKH